MSFTTTRRAAVEILEGVIVTVGEALLRRLDHDYDLPLTSAEPPAAVDDPGVSSPLAPGSPSSAASATAARPAEVSVQTAAPSAGHPTPLKFPPSASYERHFQIGCSQCRTAPYVIRSTDGVNTRFNCPEHGLIASFEPACATGHVTDAADMFEQHKRNPK